MKVPGAKGRKGEGVESERREGEKEGEGGRRTRKIWPPQAAAVDERKEGGKGEGKGGEDRQEEEELPPPAAAAAALDKSTVGARLLPNGHNRC